MCEASPCVSDLGEMLDDRPETVPQVVSEFENMDRNDFDTGCVSRFVKVLAEHLDHDGEYYRRNFWTLIRSTTEAYPDIVNNHLTDIVDVVSSDDEQQVEQLGKSLTPLVEQGFELSDRVDQEYADVLRKADPKKCRRASIELFKQSGTPTSLRTLREMAEYEVNELSMQAEEAIEDVVKHALSSMNESTEAVDLDGDSPSIIRRVAYNDPTTLESATDELFELLGTEYADVSIIALSALAKRQDSTGQTVTDRLIATVDIDENSMRGTRNDDPDSSLEQAEDALEALIRANRTRECTRYVIERADEWLNADSVELHEHALTQLRTLAEREPETVNEHVDEIMEIAKSGEAESSLAVEVLSRWGGAQSADTASYVENMLQAREDGSAIANLANTLGQLRYRPTGEVSYRQFSIDEATNIALTNVGDAVDDGKTRPTIWPNYEPRVAVLVALELALRNVDRNPDIVVFSPGGGNHWGNKSDLRKEFANYGFVPSDDTSPIPLPEIVPHARIDDGEVKTMSEGTADTRIVFSKRLEEIKQLGSLDAAILNLTARTKATYEEEIDELLESHDDTPFVPIYTNYTKHEFEERRAPRYGPPRQLDETETLPGLDAMETAVEIEPRESDFPGEFSSWFDRATESQEVRIVGVDDEGLMTYLETGYEASSELREYDEARAAGRIFSRQLMFERLPVPTDRYDDWARSQRDGYFGPRTTTALIDKLETRAEELLGRPGIAEKLFETADSLRGAREHISNENPLYEELSDRIQDDLDDGLRIGVFLPKETWRRAFQKIIKEDEIVRAAHTVGDRIVFVSPDSARDLDERDRLYIVGPQRPQYAGFYVHPSVDETVVLTYQGQWRGMIERDATRFVETRNDAAPGIDYSPYAVPEIELETPPEVDQLVDESVEPSGPGTEPSEKPTPSKSTAGSQSGSVTTGETDREELADLFDQARPIDYQSGGSSRYDGSNRREFSIETATEQTITRRDRVLRRRPDPSAKEDRYHWVSPNSLREGDKIVIIDEDILTQKWDEWLSDVYSDELSDTTTFEDLDIWHECLSDILSDLVQDPNLEEYRRRRIRQEITSAVTDFDREPATVWGWFEAVLESDSSLDPARDPALTIGPRDAADINALGERFEKDALTGENALRIEESMNRIRSINIKQGHEFRDEIKEEVNSLEDNPIKANATVYEVVSVTEI